MYCKYCGNEYEFGSKFCTDCGARIEEEPVRGAPYYTFDDTMPDPFEEEKSNKARSILALGICSLAFSTTFFAIVLDEIFQFLVIIQRRVWHTEIWLRFWLWACG